ncbi:hypothetical protein AAHA92_02603 [Salvia divinorum]|uniref:Uncharacterized protein n=1 Tax=Salvia divinorum TaxID=28513 RepID=A0ABD1IHQ8_SALDI
MGIVLICNLQEQGHQHFSMKSNISPPPNLQLVASPARRCQLDNRNSTIDIIKDAAWLAVMGWFLFATQATTSGVLVYHIPKNLFEDFPGEKKPISKTWF